MNKESKGILTIAFAVMVFSVLPASAATVSIGNYSVQPGGSVTGSLIASGVTNLGSVTLNLTYNVSVVTVTGVSAGSVNALNVPAFNIDNVNGVVRIIANNASGMSSPPNVTIANITFLGAGSAGQSPLNITIIEFIDKNFSDIGVTASNGTFNVDNTPPVITNPNASGGNPSVPATILNDNGRARAPGTNISTINVTVTDNVAVATVTINLSPIGGSANAPMVNIPGTNNYTITTNASAGVNLTNNLTVNATDTAGNSNTSVNVSLTVLRRGDVVRNNLVTGADALFIEQYAVGLRPGATAQDLFVGDVMPANITNGVTGADALYIEQLQVGLQTQQP